MARYTKLASGSWRVQVRHKGRYVSESFQRREEARRWATDMEGRIDLGAGARDRRPSDEKLEKLVEHFDVNPRQEPDASLVKDASFRKSDDLVRRAPPKQSGFSSLS